MGKAEKREIGNVHPMPRKSLRIDALCNPADFREWNIEVLCYLASSQSSFLQKGFKKHYRQEGRCHQILEFLKL